MYNIDWDHIIEECDQNGASGDGVIDFQEFISACINRKKITNKDDVKIAFQNNFKYSMPIRMARYRWMTMYF